MAKEYKAVVTPEAILVYPNLFKPTAFENSTKETYNCVLVFPKGTDLQLLKAEVAACAKAGFPNGAKGARNPLRDGNEKVEAWGDVFKDALFIRASSTIQPKVVDRRKQEILDEDEIYSGMKVRVVVYPFAYDTKGNKGVSFLLGPVQVLGKGERIAGGSSAAIGLFDELPGDDGGDMFGGSDNTKAESGVDDIFA